MVPALQLKSGVPEPTAPQELQIYSNIALQQQVYRRWVYSSSTALHLLWWFNIYIKSYSYSNSSSTAQADLSKTLQLYSSTALQQLFSSTAVPALQLQESVRSTAPHPQEFQIYSFTAPGLSKSQEDYSSSSASTVVQALRLQLSRAPQQALKPSSSPLSSSRQL